MNQSRAIIVVKNPEALRAAAASARISTQQGTALEIFEKSAGGEKDLNLLNKVLSSGHKSIIEHQSVTIAFNDVSVFAEQFIIEARLAAFTVKSRRYVDFGAAGWVRPNGLTDEQAARYDALMAARFEDYRRLLELGIPKEDARFVLPYCLRSNFYMTVDARELILLVGAMLRGRGAGCPEIVSLGTQLKAQFDGMYPGVLDRELERLPKYTPFPFPAEIHEGKAKPGDAGLIDAPTDGASLLKAAMAFSGRFPEGDLRGLLTDARPRELEALHYTFRIKRISLACLTHFTRHRMASLLIPPVAQALCDGDFVLPETVAAIPEAEAIYRRAFHEQAAGARALALPAGALPYCALSGHEIDFLLTMNARELQHFMKLRTCRRAQWEIRGVAWRMLDALRRTDPALFNCFGPSCVYGKCPEGRMSCGRPYPSIWEA